MMCSIGKDKWCCLLFYLFVIIIWIIFYSTVNIIQQMGCIRQSNEHSMMCYCNGKQPKENGIIYVSKKDFLDWIGYGILASERRGVYWNTALKIDKLQSIGIFDCNEMSDLGQSLFISSRNLRNLSLISTKISYLRKDSIQQGLNMVNLNLKENRINGMEEGAFSAMKKLRTLKLDGNQLSVFYWGWFKNLKKLNSLSISHNQIESFTNIKEENSGGNYSSKLAYHPCLRRLDISFNLLTSLEDSIYVRSPNLEYFNAESNQIENIGRHALSQLKNLRTLILRNNRLKMIYPDWFTPTMNLNQWTELNLEGNPLECSKDILQYWDFIHKSFERNHTRAQIVWDMFGITCSSPACFEGQRLGPAAAECIKMNWCPCPLIETVEDNHALIETVEDNHVVWILGSALVAVLIIAGIGILYLRKTKAVRSMYQHVGEEVVVDHFPSENEEKFCLSGLPAKMNKATQIGSNSETSLSLSCKEFTACCDVASCTHRPVDLDIARSEVPPIEPNSPCLCSEIEQQVTRSPVNHNSGEQPSLNEAQRGHSLTKELSLYMTEPSPLHYMVADESDPNTRFINPENLPANREIETDYPCVATNLTTTQSSRRNFGSGIDFHDGIFKVPTPGNVFDRYELHSLSEIINLNAQNATNNETIALVQQAPEVSFSYEIESARKSSFSFDSQDYAFDELASGATNKEENNQIEITVDSPIEDKNESITSPLLESPHENDQTIVAVSSSRSDFSEEHSLNSSSSQKPLDGGIMPDREGEFGVRDTKSLTVIRSLPTDCLELTCNDNWRSAADTSCGPKPSVMCSEEKDHLIGEGLSNRTLPGHEDISETHGRISQRSMSPIPENDQSNAFGEVIDNSEQGSSCSQTSSSRSSDFGVDPSSSGEVSDIVPNEIMAVVSANESDIPDKNASTATSRPSSWPVIPKSKDANSERQQLLNVVQSDGTLSKNKNIRNDFLPQANQRLVASSGSGWSFFSSAHSSRFDHSSVNSGENENDIDNENNIGMGHDSGFSATSM